jgi:predicted ArsR family transcriptional regulator
MSSNDRGLSSRLDWTVEQLSEGPTTAASLARLADVSPKTVRHWLDALKGEGMVQVVGTIHTGRRGKPAKAWGLL